jgi:S-adenosylmethionine-dependent methyltransferase
MALRLAAQGHAVTLLDPVDEMLHFAREKARALAAPTAPPPCFLLGSLEQAPALLGGRAFDLVLCHTLLEYLPDHGNAVRALRGLLTPGGCLSLVALNGPQEPLRLAIRDGDLEGARRALTGEGTADSLFGLPRQRVLIEDLRVHMEAAGIALVGYEGVFVFTDYLPTETLADPIRFAALLRLEVEAGARAPWREVARYLHLWGRRAG